jgi:hypothetical protein
MEADKKIEENFQMIESFISNSFGYNLFEEKGKFKGWNLEIYNPELLKNKKVWFITGLSGSGKTSLSKELAKHFNAARFEIDWLEYFDTAFTDKNDPGYSFIKRFLKENNIDPSTLLNEIPDEQFFDLQVKMIFNLLRSPVYSNKLLIVEGMQLISRFNYLSKKNIGKSNRKFYDLLPIIIINLEEEQSMKNAYRRDKVKISYEDYVKTKKDMYSSWLESFERFKEYATKNNIECIKLKYENEDGLNHLINESTNSPIEELIEQKELEINNILYQLENKEVIPIKKKTSKSNEKFLPIFVIGQSIDLSQTNLSKNQTTYVNAAKLIRTVTRGDIYSHLSLSLNTSFNEIYSFDNRGFVVTDIMKDDIYEITSNIYVACVFVTKDDFNIIENEIKSFKKLRRRTKYAFFQLVNIIFNKKTRVDKRFVCSTFIGYILSLSNKKNIHRDLSLIRPEDITILPRSFYVISFKNRDDFVNRKSEFISRVNKLYKDNYEEIKEYNNILPKVVLREKFRKEKAIEKILDNILKSLGES